MADIKSYRPKIKLDDSNNLSDLKIDAETVKGVDVVNTKQDKLDDNTKNINVATLVAKKVSLRYIKPDGTQSTGKWVGNLVPDMDNIYDLGSSTKIWNEVYVNDLKANEVNLFDSNTKTYSTFVAKTNTAPNEMVINNFLTRKPIIKDDGKKFVLYDAHDTQFLEYIYDINDFKLKNGNTPFLKCDVKDSGLIDIGTDQLALAHKEKIQIIPKYTGDFNTLTIANHNRIKIGGVEVVKAENAETYTPSDIIFAYKPANSEGKLVPFAITTDGKAFYQGYEVLNKNSTIGTNNISDGAVTSSKLAQEVVNNINSKASQTDVTNIVNGTTVVAKATSATKVNNYYPIQNITISGTTMTCTRTNNTKFSRTLPSGGSSTVLYHHTVTMSDASGNFNLIISLLNNFIIPYSNAADIISYLFNAGFNSALTLKDTSGYINSSSSYGYHIKGVYCDTTENFKCICVRSTTNVKSEIFYAASDIVNVNDVVIPLIEP